MSVSLGEKKRECRQIQELCIQHSDNRVSRNPFGNQIYRLFLPINGGFQAFSTQWAEASK
jgi:hypothetical protein